MKRPWHIGAIVLACLTVMFAVMGWITVRLVRVEERNRDMQRQAAEESITRLALWRMDAAVFPLIISESARPYYEYAAFNQAQTVYPIAYNRGETNDTLVPSPLLTQSSSNVLAYFNGAVSESGGTSRLVSPQVPTGELNDWVLDNYAVTGVLAANSANFNTFATRVTVDALREALSETGSMNDTADEGQASPSTVRRSVTPNNPAAQGTSPMQQEQDPGGQQIAMSVNEQTVRYQQTLRSQQRIQSKKQQIYDQNTDFYNTKVVQSQAVVGGHSPQNELTGLWGMPAQNVDEGVMKAAWIRNMLVLGRLVTIDGTRYVQGAWLNWDILKQELLTEIRDILPSARLSPAGPSDRADRTRVMATLPVTLIPGPCATLPALPTPSVNMPLVAAWACVLIAATAVSLLVAGTVSLSERRAAFVSAVTHELRTPLTTFQMYSEMLSDGMVPEEKKGQYFDVLRAEGARLSHLVENVLSYSRIERNRRPRSVEKLALKDVIERTRDRLERRAAQTSMRLECDVDASVANANIRADMGSIEQILFNLVDNACKYASLAQDRRIHLEVALKNGRVTLFVRDHGSGIGRHEARRLFRPFRKSAKHAAETAPGVGLGLALSHKLARRMGGRLRVNNAVTDGACFELVLPPAHD